MAVLLSVDKKQMFLLLVAGQGDQELKSFLGSCITIGHTCLLVNYKHVHKGGTMSIISPIFYSFKPFSLMV